ncbi:hypothetical protein [Brucella anthropi]|nr:hypothetical protein [Brucella anthropi]
MNNVSDTYQHITNLIIEEVEAGTKPWCSNLNQLRDMIGYSRQVLSGF